MAIDRGNRRKPSRWKRIVVHRHADPCTRSSPTISRFDLRSNRVLLRTPTPGASRRRVTSSTPTTTSSSFPRYSSSPVPDPLPVRVAPPSLLRWIGGGDRTRHHYRHHARFRSWRCPCRDSGDEHRDHGDDGEERRRRSRFEEDRFDDRETGGRCAVSLSRTDDVGTEKTRESDAYDGNLLSRGK